MSRAAERAAAVVAVLDREPGLLLAEIVDRTGLDPRPLAPLLWRMEEQGLIVHEGRRWFAVEAGPAV